MSELKPCPFCGSEAELRHNKTWDYEVRCTNCRAKTRLHHDNHIGAVDDWNSRAECTCEWELEHSGTLYDKWRCSKCGYLFVEPRCDPNYTDMVPNYCPNCGRRVVE